MLSHIQSQISEFGYAIIDPALNDHEVDKLLRAIQPLEIELAATERGGVRDLLRRVPAIRQLVNHPAIAEIVTEALGPGAFAVRGILFDKQPNANWKVPWHQDVLIAVREQKPVDGYSAWSLKNGVPHVQPPVEILERMIAVRIHLDNCGPENGPLRVLAGSHRAGILSDSEIQAARARFREIICTFNRGGLLAMRPLLLHASSPAQLPAHRRVLHLEFASGELVGGLGWFERWEVARQ